MTRGLSLSHSLGLIYRNPASQGLFKRYGTGNGFLASLPLRPVSTLIEAVHPNNNHGSHTKPPFSSAITVCSPPVHIQKQELAQNKNQLQTDNCRHSEHSKDNCIIILSLNAIFWVKATHLADTWCQNLFFKIYIVHQKKKYTSALSEHNISR